MTYVHTFAVGLLFIALPSIGAAAVLQLSSRASFGIDTGRDSGSGRRFIVLRAPISLAPSTSGRYTAGLSYLPILQIRPTDNRVTDWSHQLRGRGGYQLSPRAALSGSIDFNFSSGGFFSTGSPEDPSRPVDQGTNDHKRSIVSLDYSYRLAPQLDFGLSLQHHLARFTDPSRTDSQTVGGSANVSYRLSARDSFGGGA